MHNLNSCADVSCLMNRHRDKLAVPAEYYQELAAAVTSLALGAELQGAMALIQSQTPSMGSRGAAPVSIAVLYSSDTDQNLTHSLHVVSQLPIRHLLSSLVQPVDAQVPDTTSQSLARCAFHHLCQ